MKHDKFFLFALTALSLLLAVSCSSTSEIDANTSSDKDMSIGFDVEYNIKQINESELDKLFLESRKAIKKNPDMKEYNKNLDNSKKEVHQYDGAMAAEFEKTLDETLTSISEAGGYKVTYPELSRFVVEGECNLRYGQNDSGVYVEYNVYLQLVDNNNLPLDPSRNSSIIASHSELSNATDISTVKHYAPDTWSINGSLKGTDPDETVNGVKAIIDSAIAESFAKVL